MQIQVNTEDNVKGGEALSRRVEDMLRKDLGRFASEVTRVEVHLSDENSDKKSGATDKRCLLEARPSGLQPMSASHKAETLELAVQGAAGKLRRSLERRLGRLRGR